MTDPRVHASANASTAVPVGEAGGAGRVGNVIRGLLSGLLLGIGVALLLVVYAKVALGTKAPLVVVGVCTLLGLVLGLVARPKARRS